MMKTIFNALQARDVRIESISQFDATGDFTGIKAITYDGAEIGNKKTKVFAYLGYPQKTDKKAPAVLLVHGGGGVPFLEWVKIWNERGYVALAISVTGDFPTVQNAGSTAIRNNDEWHHGLYGAFEEDGYADSPKNDHMQNSLRSMDEQWMYHSVSQVILANNILRNDENVNPDKIGLVGISWGGVITAITIGFDNRFAFAVPIYGTGYMMESKSILGEYFRNGKNPELWLAEKNLKNVFMPVLWLCWNRDDNFSVNSNSKSYVDTVKNNADTRFSIVHEMYHDHQWAWIRKETYAFADFVCGNGKRLPSFVCKNGKFEIINPDNLHIPFVKLYYITEPLSYTEEYRMKQQWKIIRADYKDGLLNYKLPEDARAYYLEITSLMYADVYVTCSEFIEYKD